MPSCRPPSIERHCALDATGRDLLHRAAERLGWSGRGLHRVLKVARTIADLARQRAHPLDAHRRGDAVAAGVAGGGH